MRMLTCTLFTSLLLAVPLTGNAEEEKSPFQYEEKSPFTAEEKPTPTPIRVRRTSRVKPRYTVPTSMTTRLLHEKSLMQARQRRARIELRKWAGKSSLRPVLTGERVSAAEIDSVWSPWRWTGRENLRYYWHSK